MMHVSARNVDAFPLDTTPAALQPSTVVSLASAEPPSLTKQPYWPAVKVQESTDAITFEPLTTRPEPSKLLTTTFRRQTRPFATVTQSVGVSEQDCCSSKSSNTRSLPVQVRTGFAERETITTCQLFRRRHKQLIPKARQKAHGARRSVHIY